ncbi:EamA-like transporter family protein [Anatilimnocola aggregata]|uniref:EamA-like transporter family protein n=1 Tax=Anatilimnocola aggregata TaxID=2528021 RepID=A0A517YDV4_9BACT|nr:DMT family transporter [Anatilimnocola aggregata]QDU28433.1 EamA-like transporter family protein [Anatilimnocola aggregata]
MTSRSDETRGLWLGLLGVTMFAMTLPMTRLAVGPASAPQLPPMFVTAGRAAFAGLLSILYLWLTRAPRLQLRHVPALTVAALGSCVGFPLFLAWALREVDAMHAAVVTGLLPLATAIVGAIYLRQRPAISFWVCAALGCALVVIFAAMKSHSGITLADGWLVLAVISAAIGYVGGARVARDISAEQTICWVLIIALPLTLPVTIATWPKEAVHPSAWIGFTYVTLFSMWIAFFAWYRGLALGGTVRVSQVQLVQPFLALLFAVPVLGEKLEPLTVCFSLAVIGIVFLGKRMPTETRLQNVGS